MKNVTFSGNVLNRLVKPAALALLFLSLSVASVHASDGKPKAAPVEVTYIGSVSDKPLLQIAVDNAQGEEIALSLRDESGFLIYADTIKDKAYTRKLQFDDLDIDGMKLYVTLRTKNSTETKTFVVTRKAHTVEDVAVVSL